LLKTSKSKPTAEAPFARKAASKLAEAKKPALSAKLVAINRAHIVKAGLAADSVPDGHDRKHAHGARAPPHSPFGIRLLSKPEVLAITGVTFPTIWAWMRAGTFPRSRIVGGKSMWISTEIEQWLGALPLRALKGDQLNHKIEEHEPA
jgi:predicted DNA-binding transcriptional regulator AlpA